MKLNDITSFIPLLMSVICKHGSCIPAARGVFYDHDSKATKFFTQNSAVCGEIWARLGYLFYYTSPLYSEQKTHFL